MTAFVRWAVRAAATIAFVVSPAVHAAASLYAIGSDANGVGRVFTPIVPAGAGTELGDGSTAFDGGLTYLASTSRFYAVENDAFGQSSLVSFLGEAPSLLSTPVALGSGFRGGLAADPGSSKLYAIGSDSFGASTLYGVGSGGATALGALGSGYYGGLGYDTLDGHLYAITADDLGVQRRVARIDIDGSGAASATTLFDLGDGSLGFAGGLGYDEASKRFVTIASDGSGSSSLFAFSTSGAASLTDLATPLGSGYIHAGLAYASVSAVPEPSTALLFAAAGLPMLLWMRRRARRNDGRPNPITAGV